MTTKKIETAPKKTPGAINIPGEVLKAALYFAARQDVRYYLNGVMVEASKDVCEAFVVATDGHRMFACRVPQEHPVRDDLRSGLIIATDDAKAIAAAGYNLAIEGFDHVEKTITIRRTRGMLSRGRARTGLMLAEMVGGKFPDWRRVLDSALKAAPAPGIVNARYLWEAGMAQKVIGPGYRYSITTGQLCTRGSDFATFHFRGTEHEAIAVIMPMRDDPYHNVPEWCTALNPAPTANGGAA